MSLFNLGKIVHDPARTRRTLDEAALSARPRDAETRTEPGDINVPPRNQMEAARARLEIFLPSREGGQELTGAALRAGIRLEPVIEAAFDTAAYVDEAIELVRAEYEPPLACREACWYCCCCPVVLVTIPELLRILDAVDRTFDAEELASLKQRAAAYAERNQGRMLEVLAGEQPIACPILVDERCSVYDARPLTCRGYNSTDVDACRRNYEDGSVGTPLFAPVKDAADGALVGAVDALQAAGVNSALLDLGCAPNVALNYTGDDRTRDFLNPTADCRLVQQAVDELERLVKERDSAGRDSFDYELEQIRYPLAELLIYFTPASAGRLRARDADIFVSFAQARMHALRSMAAEVDAEYARDPTDER